ncbi:DUF4384 domain-containing protein [Archangium violaceum]|uniref:DUF4384 domain-containing protein n=1 Tax=Archangium violaceum TaxID=83451 RepID=UPI00193BB4A0|nr:DUF4384 domain-containing protein [Archangium violaceum]QRK06651.1 DUF4384 domain-containing protein [Archangium violaceum]
MSTTPLPPSPRGSHCPPAALLEAMSAGEAAPEATRTHVEGCADCRGQLEALTTAREAFVRARPPELFLRQLERRAAARPRPGPRWLLPVLGACVPLLALLVLVPRLGGEDGVLLKGGAFRVVVSRAGGTPELLGPDAQVRTGDALRFSYEAQEPGHLLVLELDGRGAASVFYPHGSATSAPQPAGQRDFLPGSVVLDDAPGPEWLLAVFSPRPLQAAPLLETLRAQAGRAEPTLSCPDCSVSMLRLQKRP